MRASTGPDQAAVGPLPGEGSHWAHRAQWGLTPGTARLTIPSQVDDSDPLTFGDPAFGRMTGRDGRMTMWDGTMTGRGVGMTGRGVGMTRWHGRGTQPGRRMTKP